MRPAAPWTTCSDWTRRGANLAGAAATARAWTQAASTVAATMAETRRLDAVDSGRRRADTSTAGLQELEGSSLVEQRHDLVVGEHAEVDRHLVEVADPG